MMDLTWLGAILVGAAGCLALGYCLGARCPVHFLSPNRTTKETAVSKEMKNKKPALQVEKLADILEDFKMVLVVRNDLKMGKGKIAAQCSHATLGLYKKLVNRAPKALSRWEMCGQVKVVVKTESEEEMLALQKKNAKVVKPIAQPPKGCDIYNEFSSMLGIAGALKVRRLLKERAKSAELPTHITIDAGRTQIAPNSRTVMAILGPADMVDDVTGGLKLL